MVSNTNTIKIVFVDGEVLYLSGVSNYRYVADNQLFVIEKNGYNQFFPRENVKFIGRKTDLGGD